MDEQAVVNLNNLERMLMAILCTGLRSMPFPILVLYVAEYEIPHEILPCCGFSSSGMLHCVAQLTDSTI